MRRKVKSGQLGSEAAWGKEMEGKEMGKELEFSLHSNLPFH